MSSGKKKEGDYGTYYYLNKWGVWLLHDSTDPYEDDYEEEGCGDACEEDCDDTCEEDYADDYEEGCGE